MRAPISYFNNPNLIFVLIYLYGVAALLIPLTFLQNLSRPSIWHFTLTTLYCSSPITNHKALLILLLLPTGLIALAVAGRQTTKIELIVSIQFFVFFGVWLLFGAGLDSCSHTLLQYHEGLDPSLFFISLGALPSIQVIVLRIASFS